MYRNVFVSILLFAAALPHAHATYISEVMADSPILHYRFDETAGTTFANAGTLGAALNATANGGVTLGVSGPILSEPGDRAVTLDGVSAYITANSALSGAAFSNDGDYSIEIWFQESQNHQGDLVALTNNSGDQHGILIEANGTGNTFRMLHRVPSGTSGGANVGATGFTHTTGPGASWHHLVVVHDGSQRLFYLDGVQDTVIGTAGSPTNFDLNVTIGRLRQGSGPRYYNGNVDEFALYDQALSPARIQAHYLAASIPEPSTMTLVALGAVALFRRNANAN